jgi:hypothetical protein
MGFRRNLVRPLRDAPFMKTALMTPCKPRSIAI